jgi:hypothetical protein
MLSQKAQICLENFKKPYVNYYENLDHDGYDSYGPKSDLWDFYIFYNEKGQLLVDFYHWENWFGKDDDKRQYTLWKTYTMDEFINKPQYKKICGIY